MTSETNIDIQKEFSERLQVHKNLAHEVVVTTVDKLRICLMENRDVVTAKHEWITPGSLLLTCITTIVAADFKKFVFEANVWQAVFVLLGIASLIWLVVSARKAWAHRNDGSIEQVVSKIKTASAQDMKGAAG